LYLRRKLSAEYLIRSSIADWMPLNAKQAALLILAVLVLMLSYLVH
jgi:hypothetical protein